MSIDGRCSTLTVVRDSCLHCCRIYKASGKPRYPTGQFTNFAFLLLTSITALGLELFYVTRNRKMVKLVGEPKDLYKY